MVFSWLHSLVNGKSSAARKTSRTSRRSFKPAVEVLEDRQLMTGGATLQLSGTYSVNSYAGVGLQENMVGEVLISLNGKPDTNQSDFQASINWGDGKSSAADLVYVGSDGVRASYLIKGSHIYSQIGTNIPISVSVIGDGGSTSGITAYSNVAAMPSGIKGSAPAPVAPSMDPANVNLTVSGTYTVNSYAGVGLQENMVGEVLVSLNGQPDSTLSDVHAQINWGDSASWTPADLVYVGSDGVRASYLIKGSHIYTQAKSNIPVVVYVNGPDGTSTSGLASYANVSAMPSGIPGTQPAATPISLPPSQVGVGVSGIYSVSSTVGVGFTEKTIGQLSASLNGQADPDVNDFHVQINWGDGAGWTTGDLVYQGSDTARAYYTIRGSHVYNQATSNSPVIVYVTGPDGTSVSGLTSYASASLPTPPAPAYIGTGVMSASVAFDGQGRQVTAVVFSSGQLYVYDAAGAHYIGSSIQSASVAFNPQGQEVMDVVFASSELWSYDASGAHYIGTGVQSVSVTFDRQGHQVTAAVFNGGGLYVFDTAGVHYVAPNVQSVSIAFDGQGNEVLDLVYSDTTLYQFDSTGAHYLGSGFQAVGIAYNRYGQRVMDAVFTSSDLWQY